jgi:hypothetical protein
MLHIFQADLHQRIANQLEQLVQLCPPDQVSAALRYKTSHISRILLLFLTVTYMLILMEVSAVPSSLHCPLSLSAVAVWVMMQIAESISSVCIPFSSALVLIVH